jgi:hypothetical protein
MKNAIIYLVLYSVLIAVLPMANLSPVSAQTKNRPAGNNIDKGDFKVGYSPATLKQDPKKSMPKEIADLLREITKPLNEIIALPYDVYVNFDICGQPNAFYNPNTKEITMCVEFIDEFERIFKQVSEDEADVSQMIDGAVAVFFFHELGHCLIDVWDLPATGREEDAVDQLAMYILLDGTPEGEQMVLSAAIFFRIASSEQNDRELAFWDEHSLDQQRFYDMVCQIYGSNPTKNKFLLGKDGLPPERAQRCPAEFKRVDHSWSKLLAPYLKK